MPKVPNETPKNPIIYGRPQEGVEAKIVYESKQTGSDRENIVEVTHAENNMANTPAVSWYIEAEDDARDRKLEVWCGGTTDESDESVVWSRTFNLSSGRKRRDVGKPKAIFFPAGYKFEVKVPGITKEEAEKLTKYIPEKLTSFVNDLLRSRTMTGDDEISVNISEMEELPRADKADDEDVTAEKGDKG